MSDFTEKDISKNYYGHEEYVLTDEDIEKLKAGKELFADFDDEYSFSLKYKNIAFDRLIPDDVTNGDVIKIMFPNAEIKEIRGTFEGNLLGYRTWLGGRSQDFLLDWWNAPFKRGESLDMAIKALEKDTPKAPKQSDIPRYGMGYEFYDWYCPTCNKFLAHECDSERHRIHHCECGQRLDWGKVK